MYVRTAFLAPLTAAAMVLIFATSASAQGMGSQGG